MTTAKEILNGTEPVKSYVLRNRKFLIIAGIGIIIIYCLRRYLK